jgi:hypothetical protein
MAITGKQLFALCPFGALVTFSDGKPRPPERFVKKVKEWERNNGRGVFLGITPLPEKPRDWDRECFALQTSASDAIIVNTTFTVDSPLSFEFVPPAPGTVLWFTNYKTQRGRREVNRTFESKSAAFAWGDRKGYSLLEQTKYSAEFAIVGENGELIPWTPER